MLIRLITSGLVALSLSTGTFAMHHANTDRPEGMRVEQLQTALGLTDEQTTAVTNIMRKQKEQAKALREATRDQRKALREQTRQELSRVLTAEQMDLLDERRRQQAEKRSEKKAHSN